MKDTTKKILAGVLLGSTLSMVGCVKNDPTVKSVTINGDGAGAYLVGDIFDATKYKLDVEMSDGTTKSIDVTSAMIVANPDMTSSGEKTVKIKYEGKEYELKFTVGGYSKAEMLAKLNAFLEDYNNANANSISATFEAEYAAKFMDKTDGDQTASTEPAVWTKEMNANDPLLALLYKTLIASLNGEMTQEDITNSNELKAQLEFMNVLNNIKTGMLNVDYLLTNVFHAESPYFEMIASGLSEALKLSTTGTTELQNLLESEIPAILNSLKTDATEPYDFAELVADIVDIIGYYCTDVTTAGLVTSAYEVATLDEENRGHELSTFLYNLNYYVQFFKVYEEVDDPEFEDPEITMEQEVTGIEARNVSFVLTEKIGAVIECIEDLAIAERDKESLEEDDYEHARNTALNLMKIAFDQMPTCYEEYMEEGWYLDPFANAVVMSSPYLSTAVADYKNSETPVEFVVKTIKSNSLVEMLSSMLVSALNGEDGTAFDALEPLIPQLVYDVLDGVVAGEKTELVADNYLPSLYELFETEAQDQTRYETEWENTGFSSIISEGLYDILYNDYADESDIENIAAIKLVRLVEYIEDCLRTKSYGEGEGAIVAKDFVWKEFEVLAHEFLEAYSNGVDEFYGNSNIGNNTDDDIASEMQAIKNNIITPLILLTDPEKTWTEKIDSVIELNSESIAGAIANMMISYAGISPEIEDKESHEIIPNPVYEDAMTDAYEIGEDLVEKYLAGTLTANDGLKGLFTIIDDYSEEEVKYMYKSIALGAMISMGPNPEIDYDKLFDFVKLPEGVEDIDYNEVVNKYWQYAKELNMINISKVDVKYETNPQTGEIDKEICEITFNFNYDILVLGLDATFKLKLEIDL